MSLNYYAGAQGQDPAKELDCRRSPDASESILLTEYGMLLRTTEPVRIVNRTLLVGLSLLQFLFSPSVLSKQVLVEMVVVVACAFWFLQDYVIGRKLGRLGELIAATNADALGDAEIRSVRAVVPPPKKGSQTPATTSNATIQDHSLPKSSLEQAWTNSYVSWRQEAWKARKFLTIQRAEPLLWFLLTLTVEIYRFVATR
jgi:hypothetical protein